MGRGKRRIPLTVEQPSSRLAPPDAALREARAEYRRQFPLIANLLIDAAGVTSDAVFDSQAKLDLRREDGQVIVYALSGDGIPTGRLGTVGAVRRSEASKDRPRQTLYAQAALEAALDARAGQTLPAAVYGWDEEESAPEGVIQIFVSAGDGRD